MKLHRYSIITWLTASLASAANLLAESASDTVLKTPGLVAFWDFKEEPGQLRVSSGTKEKHALKEVGGPITRVEGGPFSGFSADLNGKQYFTIPYAETGDLNISGPDAQVSMFAAVRIVNLEQSRTIAGMWSEGAGKNDDSGTRQYAMLMNMPTYGGPRQLVPHISSEGGVTRRADGSAFPWCADYAATRREVPEEKWCTLGFTYDGKYIRAYIDGVLDKRELDPAKDKRNDPYFTSEGPGGKDRGMNPYYHGRGIFKYDPKLHAKSKPIGGSDFTVGARFAVGDMLREATIGRFGGLAVFNRVLTDAEMKKIHDAANVSLLDKPVKPSRAVATVPYVNQVPFVNFITRDGNKLKDGKQTFRFAGANMPGIMLPYDFTLFLPERMNLPTPWEQEDAFKTLKQLNAGVLRTWNLPIRKPNEEKKPWHYVLAPGEFNEEAFKCTDHMLALANKYGIRVMFALTAGSGDYLGGMVTYAEHRGKKPDDFYTDPQIREDYKATVCHVLNRTNTVTGVKYRDDKAVMAWQFGNELAFAPGKWLSEMAAYIKSQAPDQLVAETVHRPGRPMTIDPNIDLVTRHLYPDYPGTENGWIAAMQKEMAKLKDQRPLFIGEYGPYIDNKMFTRDNVVEKFHEFHDYLESQESIAGSLFWSMYFHHQDGGFYHHQIFTYPAAWSFHWPGFPSAEAQREEEIMHSLREVAFRIQGKPLTPIPIPDSPTLLPFSDTPMFSWRGSAGASGYDIERAESADGPWTRIAENHSDAAVAYRPHFSDTTATIGKSYHYRVSARNESGASKPSNMIGPVLVKQLCLVDEFENLDKLSAKTGEISTSNDFSALYAEYLFRAKGGPGASLSYQVPGMINSLVITAFFDKGIADPTLEVSADGKTYITLKPKRVDCRLPGTPGGAFAGKSRTMVTYTCPVPDAHTHLKITLNAPTELDRLEIHHQ